MILTAVESSACAMHLKTFGYEHPRLRISEQIFVAARGHANHLSPRDLLHDGVANSDSARVETPPDLGDSDVCAAEKERTKHGRANCGVRQQREPGTSGFRGAPHAQAQRLG